MSKVNIQCSRSEVKSQTSNFKVFEAQLFNITQVTFWTGQEAVN